MTVKELFAKHSVENAELIAEVEGLLATAESKKTEGIPQSRFSEKCKECNDLKSDKVELEAEISKLQTKLETAKGDISKLKLIETEYNTTLTKQKQENKAEWEKICDQYLNVDESDTRYDKIQPILKNFVIDKPNDDQITANLKVFKLLEPTGVFGEEVDIEDGVRPGKKKIPDKNPFDIVNGKPRDYGMQLKLFKEDPESAKKLQKEAQVVKE